MVRWLSMGLLVALVAGLAVWWLRGAAPESAIGPGIREAESPEPLALQPIPEVGAEARDPQEASTADDEAANAVLVAASKETPHIDVSVTDVDRQPVSGARVEITGDAPLGAYETDESGSCVLPLAPGWDFVELRISMAGFATACVRGPRSQRIDVVLRSSVNVLGRVTVDAESTPVIGARIALDGFDCTEEPIAAISDAQGRFELRGLPLQQMLQWHVHADGFRTLERQFELRGESGEIEFALSRGVPLEFLVVDADKGTGIEGASIQRGSTTVTTDASGRAMSSALLGEGEDEAGLLVAAPGHCSVSARLRASDVQASEVLRMPLLAGAALWGLALDEEGEPIPSIRLNLSIDYGARRDASANTMTTARDLVELPADWSVQGAEYLNVESDATGRFEFVGLEPLSQRYQMRALGTKGSLGNWIAVQPLGPPGSTTHQDLVVYKTGTIRGTLTLNGSPTAGSVSWQGATRKGSGRVDAAGTFRIEGVELGHVSLRPVPDGAIPLRGCESRFTGPWIVEVTSEAEASTDIALELELAPISGRVVDVHGAPRSEVRVGALARDACWRGYAMTADDGSFEFSVRAGGWSYELWAGDHPDSVVLDGIAAGTHDVELVLPGSGMLRVRVVDAETGTLLDRFALEPVDDFGKSIQFISGIDSSFKADAEGWFQVKLRPGNWHLYVGDHRQGVSGYLPADGGTVRIQDGGPTPAVEIARERGIDLELRVAESPSVPGVLVLFLESDRIGDVQFDGKEWHIGESFRGLQVLEARRVRPDAFGLARVRSLRSGAYRFVAFPDTIAIAPAAVVVTGKETEPLEIRWQPR